ncbi:hypothetical protein BamMEX5DRAFT_6953 [Burkholderia ambifaria MEX-5]|uniref:Uncharacterized protein n=1 Tax=Burkholderia ambifaria MEX-5 TaxID=396597 RepID=B1TGN7_9BURK|nr:hypothetical protein BamMEX5DRAFT_6953 [Burkholderia ambifaria MEX-5]
MNAASNVPSGVASTASVRSNFADGVPDGSHAADAAPSDGSARRSPYAAITWNSGWWLALRGTPSASTTCSNGTSWCICASTSARCVRATSDEKSPCAGTSTSIASVLTKKPIRPATSARSRFAAGTPTQIRASPVARASSASSAASSTANGVAPDAAANARNCAPMRASSENT